VGETEYERFKHVLSMMSDDDVAEMYARIVYSNEYVPVHEIGESLWNRLRDQYSERALVRAISLHCRARLGIGS